MTSPIKALSIQQPWAWAIVHASKRIENRTWTTSHRGPIAIHASARIDRDALDDSRIRAALREHPTQPEYVTGAVIAVANLVDIHTCPGACSMWAAWDQRHWQLNDIRPLASPVPARGALGLWTLPDDVRDAVAEQLAATAR